MSDMLIFEKDTRGVATLQLNRPQIHNAFNDELISELTEKAQAIQKDSEVRLLILTGSGKSFCAGADINWMKKMGQYTMQENLEDSFRLQEMLENFHQLNVPILGRINGHALGGGVGLVSLCDYAIAADHAKFGLTEVALGLLPAVISPYVLSKISESYARAYALSGERFKADRAKEMQLVHEVCSLENLDQRVKELTETFLQSGPMAARECKELLRGIYSLWNKETQEAKNFTCQAIAARRMSDEGQEGMSALLEKRTASWKN